MRLAVALVAVGIAVAFGASASQASAPAPIVFAADRAPTVTGEIYRIGARGHRVNLSRSPYYDSSPAVSSDGRHVAFISNRSGGSVSGVYEVGIDGGGLVPLARRVPDLASNAPLAWQPHGDRVATGSSILERGHRQINDGDFTLAAPQPWSPDGRVLLLSDYVTALTHAVSPDGRRLWATPILGAADVSPPVWSSTGLLAGATDKGIAVYDEAGYKRFGAPLGVGVVASWSPDGSLLAIEYGATDSEPQVRTASGSVVLRKHIAGGGGGVIAWAGDSTVVAGYAGKCGCRSYGIDVHTGKVGSASARWLDPLSQDGKLALVVPRRGRGFALGVAPPGGGPVTTYLRIPGCADEDHGDWEPAVASQQFAGHSIVYDSGGAYCDPPAANLYSYNGRLHRITKTHASETQPVLSPDGSEIAFVWNGAYGSNCIDPPHGPKSLPIPCSDGIVISTVDGKPIRTLTNDPDGCLSDDSPTWSPDGTTILYTEHDECSDGANALFTVPAAGGTPTRLHIRGWRPAWGPTRIAFVDKHGLVTAKPDGSDQVVVSKHGEDPAWSPNGQLAYRVGTSLVVGTKRAIRLPFTTVRSLAWTPDGKRLVIAASRTKDAPLDLYSVKPDGTGLKRLTKNFGVS